MNIWNITVYWCFLFRWTHCRKLGSINIRQMLLESLLVGHRSTSCWVSQFLEFVLTEKSWSYSTFCRKEKQKNECYPSMEGNGRYLCILNCCWFDVQQDNTNNIKQYGQYQKGSIMININFYLLMSMWNINKISWIIWAVFKIPLSFHLILVGLRTGFPVLGLLQSPIYMKGRKQNPQLIINQQCSWTLLICHIPTESPSLWWFSTGSTGSAFGRVPERHRLQHRAAISEEGLEGTDEIWWTGAGKQGLVNVPLCFTWPN